METTYIVDKAWNEEYMRRREHVITNLIASLRSLLSYIKASRNFAFTYFVGCLNNNIMILEKSLTLFKSCFDTVFIDSMLLNS